MYYDHLNKTQTGKCQKESPRGFYCTRPYGHKGLHEAKNLHKNKILDTWDKNEIIIEDEQLEAIDFIDKPFNMMEL